MFYGVLPWCFSSIKDKINFYRPEINVLSQISPDILHVIQLGLGQHLLGASSFKLKTALELFTHAGWETVLSRIELRIRAIGHLNSQFKITPWMCEIMSKTQQLIDNPGKSSVLLGGSEYMTIFTVSTWLA